MGVDNLILSCVNIVGTIRNSRDSGHGNDRDVEKWGKKWYIVILYCY